MKGLLFLLTLMLSGIMLVAQTDVSADSSFQSIDSAGLDSTDFRPGFSTPSAWVYVDQIVNSSSFWRSEEEPLREALQRLLNHTVEPFDSTRMMLQQEDFSMIEVHKSEPQVTGSYPLKWLNDSTFLIDPRGWNSDLYLKREIKLIYPPDTTFQALTDTSANNPFPVDKDSTIAPQPVPDTLFLTHIDTAALTALEIELHSYKDKLVTPPMMRNGETGYLNEDRTKVLYFSPGNSWRTAEDSPFMDLNGAFQLDSLQFAVEKLLEFTRERDSTLVWFRDLNGRKIPFWLNHGHKKAERYWVKNYKNDSITVWIGNPAANEISLLLEDDVSINRMMKEDIKYLPHFVEEPEKLLLSMSVLEPAPIFWDYKLGSVLTMNQTYLANWTKGGESSFTTMIDITGEATYNNKDANTQWSNIARFQFGTLMTQDNGFRKSQDQFEINSKLNRNASGKIGMSSTFYMKNQVARGYDYSGDSAVTVSKFLNPATMTIGMGFEYKPISNTTLNVAPLSYKNTFVLDTALIDQTKHGIEEGKRSRQELGLQIVLYNKLTPYQDLTVVNRLRLFSNYLHKPQNVDVDWELILDQKINMFFTIRLNLHLIYDDDTKFAVLDSNGDAILLPGGEKKTVAKTQFKEFVGLSLQFNF